MSNTKTVMSQAANTLVKPLDVEDVFSTYLYTGNGSTQTITNGIDLDGEGGLVWEKVRSTTGAHILTDTERGVSSFLSTNDTDAAGPGFGATSFNSDGFDSSPYSTVDVASWTFRKAPKFFDVVTYTGDGVAGRTVSHNLGATVGTILVKKTSGANEWTVYHRSLGSGYGGYLNLTSQFYESTIWGSTEPTSTEFTVSANDQVNGSGGTYVAYLFAHNDGDGGFNGGDIIKCGSFDLGSTGVVDIDLGFEPQWVMYKRTDGAGNWLMVDTMRGLTYDQAPRPLIANDSSAEPVGSPASYIRNDGFRVSGSANQDYIYIAIRRGTKVPESATEVFAMDTWGNGPPAFTSGFPVDMSFTRDVDSGGPVWYWVDRLRGIPSLSSNDSSTETTAGLGTDGNFDFQDGWYNKSSSVTDYQAWMWKRAPNFFDVVAYTGDGVQGRTVSHNLGVAPEMIWVKGRDIVDNWVGWSQYGPIAGSDVWSGNLNNTGLFIYPRIVGTPTATSFDVSSNGETNNSGYNYIAYLFASLDGVSKVGSYTGNGTSQTIDCGFTSGARFILVKRTDSTGDWYVWDTERGIVAGNDPYLELNTTDAEVTSTDWVDPDNSGFIVNGTTINASSAEYIFYAIA